MTDDAQTSREPGGSAAAAALRLVVISVIAALGVLAAGVVVLAGATMSAYMLDSGQVLGVPVALDLPWPIAAIRFAVLGAILVVLAFALIRLQRILGTLAQGDPFVAINAKEARLLWIVCALFEFSRYAMAVFLSARAALNQPEPPPAAMAVLVPLVGQFRPIVWLAILVIFVLAEVFREGARMRAEQQLTI